MKLLYIFPHPDDESFGPAGAINQQINDGHEVHLLTLTKGGATQVRHKLNLNIEEMGAIRHKEMLNVKEVLNLNVALKLFTLLVSQLATPKEEDVVDWNVADKEVTLLVIHALRS